MRVRVLMDDMYTAGDDELLRGFAAHPNIELRLYNPFPAGRGRVATRGAYAHMRIAYPERPEQSGLFA